MERLRQVTGSSEAWQDYSEDAERAAGGGEEQQDEAEQAADSGERHQEGSEQAVNSGERRRSYPRETHRRMGQRALRSGRYGRGSDNPELRPDGQGWSEASMAISERAKLEQNDRLLARFDDSGIKMGDFVGIYGVERVLKDQEWLLGRAQGHARMRKSPEAAQFEDIFIQGVNTGNWLGNITTTQQGKSKFEAFAMKAALFDDLSGKTDDIVELKFAEPIEGEDDTSITSVKLAFDVTTAAQQGKIREKLTSSCNSVAGLHHGRTVAKYLKNGDKCEPVTQMWRYTIGLSKYDIRDIWERSDVSTRYGGKIRQMPPSLQNQFKVLTELRAQNELFYAMLPDDADETERLELEAADECFNEALANCTRTMVQRKVLPREVRDRIEAKHRQLAAAGARDTTVRDRGIIEEYLLASSSEYFRKCEQERARRTGEEPEEDCDDPFVQIVTEARKLTAMAQAGELDKYRGLMARNRGF